MNRPKASAANRFRSAVEKTIKESGLSNSAWAVKNDIPIATLHEALEKGTAAGRTLAKLQRAGVVIADKKLIESLDTAA